ncbi:MAG: 16S rRNA (guanine(966)-N(2))-methyltransferase RsmD [Parachlamydiales bacterium]|nr:16S rRNA (guanine(966)-N(2))-methyltransferase RsmD [Parachlamydiales bacterium]
MKILSGKFKGRSLFVPKAHVRPSIGAIREAVFNIFFSPMENKKVLDLFAGTGVMGLEALSRGALHATFVDTHVHAIHKNIQLLGVKENTTSYRGDVLKVITRIEGPFDLIYMDPPYSLFSTSFSSILFVLRTIFEKRLLSSKGMLFLEAPRLHLEGLEEFPLKKEKKFGDTLLFVLYY